MIAATPPAGTVNVTQPLYIRSPSDIHIPDGVTIQFRQDGQLITAFGKVRQIRITAHGAGYTAVPNASIEGTATLGGVKMGLSQFLLAKPGSGYRPGDVVTLTGGAAVRPARLTVAATQVVAATVATPGTGGINGRQIVTGTSGTGVAFRALVTIDNGRIVRVEEIQFAGRYTANPDNPAREPVTGANLTGAMLRLEMGIGTTMQGKVAGNPTVYISDFGLYTAMPEGDIALAGGTGQGAALNRVSWHVQAVDLADGGQYSTGTPPRVVFHGGGARFEARAEAVGDSLRIDGKVAAGQNHVFAGYGRVSGHLGNAPIEARWFGADPTGGQDSTDALRAWAQAVPSPGGVGHCGAGTYIVSGTILQRSGTTLRCEGAASVWRVAASFTGFSPPAYTFPYSTIDNTVLTNERFDAPFDPVQKVDRDLSVEDITLDYTLPSALLVPGNKAIVYRMVQNASAVGITCFHVGACTTMMASDTTRVVRLRARGVANAAADHWESPRNATVEDPDIDLRGDPFNRTLYGVLFTGTDTATRFGSGMNNTVRGGKITGFRDAALWSDDGVEHTTVERTVIDCAGNDHAVGLYFTGLGGRHIVDATRFQNCSRPVVFTNEQRGAWPQGIVVRNVTIDRQRLAAPFSFNGAPPPRTLITPALVAEVTGSSVNFDAGFQRPPYTIMLSPGVRLTLQNENSLEPGLRAVTNRRDNN